MVTITTTYHNNITILEHYLTRKHGMKLLETFISFYSLNHTVHPSEKNVSLIFNIAVKPANSLDLQHDDTFDHFYV